LTLGIFFLLSAVFFLVCAESFAVHGHFNKTTTSLVVVLLPYSALVVLGKNATHKERSQEKSHVHRAKFNGRLELPGWPGKGGAAQALGEAWLL
jgi:hypothetical protein